MYTILFKSSVNNPLEKVANPYGEPDDQTSYESYEQEYFQICSYDSYLEYQLKNH